MNVRVMHNTKPTQMWFCPNCGTYSIETTDYLHDGMSIYVSLTCLKCGCEWENEYVYVKTVLEIGEQNVGIQ